MATIEFALRLVCEIDGQGMRTYTGGYTIHGDAWFPVVQGTTFYIDDMLLVVESSSFARMRGGLFSQLIVFKDKVFGSRGDCNAARRQLKTFFKESADD